MTGKFINWQSRLFLFLNFLICLILAYALLFYFFNIYAPLRNERILAVISILATTTVVLSALRSLREKRISIDLLASIALILALVQQEWVSAIFINLMISCARAFIEFVKVRSHSAIAGLMKAKPKKVKIRHDNGIKEIPSEQIKKGDKVIIDLGEVIPVDGVVEEGEAMINQASLTGESIPVFKKKGDQVLSFTTVASGNLVIVAEKIGKDTNFEKIVGLIEQSQEGKTHIKTLSDKFSKWYIVFVVFGSFFVYIFSRDMNLVLAALLVSCADDVAVATPLALMSALVHSAKHGAIIKGGDFLEALPKIKVVVFDKTGTLTKGRLKLEKIISFNGFKETEVLRLAGITSLFSTHPIAKTIVSFAKTKKILIEEPDSYEEYGGKGMSAVFKGKKIAVGKEAFFKELKVKMDKKQISQIESEKAQGYNVSLVGYDDEIIGYIVLFDELRPKIKQVIDDLKKAGVRKTVMLTGDNEKIAAKISEIIGIDEFHANLLPKDKLRYLKKYLSRKYKVAMIGDGINDAPVLALSDIGIAMGAIGSDAAIDAADIAMMKDDLSQIPELMKISKMAINVIKQNIFMWGVLNVIGFFLVFTHVLNPSGASFYNFISDFIPIINSLTLFKR